MGMILFSVLWFADMGNLDAATILDFAMGDFETAWNAVATRKESVNRGNFMFALQAMVLLEVASHICMGSPNADRFSLALSKRNPGYFTKLPWRCRKPKGLTLPYRGTEPQRQLLHILFDLVRNGQAHQYQQIVVTIENGQHFSVTLTGADYGRSLDSVLKDTRPPDHLRADIDEHRDVWMTVRPDVLYLDIREAVRVADLRSCPFTHIDDKLEHCSSEALIRALYSHFNPDTRRKALEGMPTKDQMRSTGLAEPADIVLITRLSGSDSPGEHNKK